MWRSDNSDDHDNINKPVQLLITSHVPDVIKFLQVISLKSLFMMRGNGSLGYRSRKTRNCVSCRPNNDDGSSKEEGLEVYLGQ